MQSQRKRLHVMKSGDTYGMVRGHIHLGWKEDAGGCNNDGGGESQRGKIRKSKTKQITMLERG